MQRKNVLPENETELRKMNLINKTDYEDSLSESELQFTSELSQSFLFEMGVLLDCITA